MGRYASDTGGGSFKQAPEGTHVARCCAIVDIGTQHGEYQGKPVARNQIIVRWELPLETEEIDGEQKPLICSAFYTNSLHEKARLRGHLESWRGKSFTADELKKFDLMNILGKPCMVSIVHSDQNKAKVMSVTALPKGATCPPGHNKPFAFWIDEWSEEVFDALPKGFKLLIESSDEYKEKFSGKARPQTVGGPVDQLDDDIPFN